MSLSPAALEGVITLAIESLKRGYPYFDIIELGLRVGNSGAEGGLGCISIPGIAPAPIAPIAPQAATSEVVDAMTSVTEKGQTAALIEKVANGDIDGIQEILAGAGVMLVPIPTDGASNSDVQPNATDEGGAA